MTTAQAQPTTESQAQPTTESQAQPKEGATDATKTSSNKELIRLIPNTSTRRNPAPVKYDYNNQRVELWVLVGPESAIGSATSACTEENGREALKQRLEATTEGERVYLVNDNDANAPGLWRNYYVAFCPFVRSNSDTWTYVDDVKQIGITQLEIADSDGRGVTLESTKQFDDWLKGSVIGRRYQVSADVLYSRTSGRWPYKSKASIRFHISPPQAGAGSFQVPVFFSMMTKYYFHASLALANSYGIGFGDGGKAVAMPLTVALGADWMPVEKKSFFLGGRIVAAPSFNFTGGTLQQITSLAFGVRADFDDYFGVGVGPQINFEDGHVKGVVFVSVGPALLNLLTR